MTELESPLAHRSPRLNRTALWVSSLIAVELAAAGAVLFYRAPDEGSAADRLVSAGIVFLIVLGVHAAFWTVVWALRSRPMRTITAWAAFVVLMISCALTALLGAITVVSYQYPLN